MEMKDIMKELEEKLAKAKTQKKDWESKKKFWTEAVNTADRELSILEDDIGNMEMMIEAAKGIHHTYKDDKPEKAKKETKKEEVKEEIDPKHRKAMVLQINQYDNVTNRWKTQRDAAKELATDQSTLSKFMKLSKDVQIQRKGYALVWQY